MRGIFYNSKKTLCSIWESGDMCYKALSGSSMYTLEYSEENYIDFDNLYDFVIINQHHCTNNWINIDIINRLKSLNILTFCIVTEVGLTCDVIASNSPYFHHYIVLDPTIIETNNIHSFPRPLEDSCIVNHQDDRVVLNEMKENVSASTIKVGSFGFATHGKDWYKIVECVHNEFDDAEIHFNIPRGTFVPVEIHDHHINEIKTKSNNIITKPGIILKITHDVLTKQEIINFCASNTINCFFYNRCFSYSSSGLSAVTDQAIVSEKPLLVTGDLTFRHIHKYIDYYPNISIKDAIVKNVEGVKKMKEDWGCNNFLMKFEQILKNQND